MKFYLAGLLAVGALLGGCSAKDGSDAECASARLCGAACCGDGELCSFERCQVPGVACVDDGDCAGAEFCDLGAGALVTAAGGVCEGVEYPTGRCLPRPPQCAAGQSPGSPQSCLATCGSIPAPGWVVPVLEAAWGDPVNTDQNVMTTPVLGQLDDDNCDGTIDERDVPEIVFLSFSGGDYQNTSGTASTLRAVSVIDGVMTEKWSSALTGISADVPVRALAVGNLDGLPGAEIVTCTRDGRVRAYRPDGTELWLSSPLATSCYMPSIADVDQDGVPEVIPGPAILDGATGAVEVATFVPAYSPTAGVGQPVVVDVDGDGALDVVMPGRAYAAGGTLIADTMLSGSSLGVADLDGDDVPEVVSVDFTNHLLAVWRVAAGAPGGYEILRQGLDLTFDLTNACPVGSSGYLYGGGPPAIGDLDGDGTPDVVVSRGFALVALDGKDLVDPLVANADTLLWAVPIADCTSAQASAAAFDFDGDGAAEVVFGGETRLLVLDGATGDTLLSTCNTNGTMWENPIVADVDSDGRAEIVAPSNSYSSLNCSGVKTTGIRVFGAVEGGWARTRSAWNEHAFHVTNVLGDGTIPLAEPAHYLDAATDGFRTNPIGSAEADLVVSVWPDCAVGYRLVARVRNVGSAFAAAGVPVAFYDGAPSAGGALLGEAITTRRLEPLGSEDVQLTLAAAAGGPVYAVVNDGVGAGPWRECSTENNVSPPAEAGCGP